jgi:hypothetical protein
MFTYFIRIFILSIVSSENVVWYRYEIFLIIFRNQYRLLNKVGGKSDSIAYFVSSLLIGVRRGGDGYILHLLRGMRA